MLQPMNARLLTMITASVLMACEDEAETLADPLEDGQAHTTDLRAEVDAHLQAAEQAESLAAWQGQEPSHRAIADEHMGEFDHAMDGMHRCNPPEEKMGPMMETYQHCLDEISRHHQAIADCPNLDDAMAEEQAHHGAMTTYLAHLNSSMDDMMHHHGMSMCNGPGHNGR